MRVSCSFARVVVERQRKTKKAIDTKSAPFFSLLLEAESKSPLSSTSQPSLSLSLSLPASQNPHHS